MVKQPGIRLFIYIAAVEPKDDHRIRWAREAAPFGEGRYASPALIAHAPDLELATTIRPAGRGGRGAATGGQSRWQVP